MVTDVRLMSTAVPVVECVHHRTMPAHVSGSYTFAQTGYGMHVGTQSHGVCI